VLPELTRDGLLPPGQHTAMWSELRERFGFNTRRRGILGGIRQAAAALSRGGCRRLWIDGSFVTAKTYPADWDGCWDPTDVDPKLVDPALLDFSALGRHRMKVKYLADLFPSSIVEQRTGLAFVDFFQVDKTSGTGKGLVLLDLTAWMA